MKFSDAKLTKLMRQFFTPLRGTDGQAKYEIKKLPIQWCVTCLNLKHGCDTQNTVCRVVAQEWPFSLQRKELNNLCYEVRT